MGIIQLKKLFCMEASFGDFYLFIVIVVIKKVDGIVGTNASR